MQLSELPPTIFVAAGAVLASIITGAISFVNLVISKDQKISEFRQDWINKLREDIAEFEGNLVAISLAWQVIDITLKKYENKVEALEFRIDDFYKLITNDLRNGSKIHRRIILTLNPVEHKLLIDKLEESSEILNDPDKLKNIKNIDDFANQLTEITHDILKKEWKRVKRGESSYCITKYSVLVVFVIFIIASIFWTLTL